MSDKSYISIDAFVSENERTAVHLAASHIAQALSRTTKTPWLCEATVRLDMEALKAGNAAMIVTSLLPELEKLAEPWTEEEKRLRTTYAALGERGIPVFICTILRHIGSDVDADLAETIIVRLRRLNLLAAEISRECGAYLIDLDRVLADVGARRLQTDYRLAGNAAAQMAGHFMALTMLANAPEEIISFEVQNAAREILTASRPVVVANEATKTGALRRELRAVGQDGGSRSCFRYLYRAGHLCRVVHPAGSARQDRPGGNLPATAPGDSPAWVSRQRGAGTGLADETASPQAMTAMNNDPTSHLRMMMLIRAFETALAKRRDHGFQLLSSGEEAVAVGLCSVLTAKDQLLTGAIRN